MTSTKTLILNKSAIAFYVSPFDIVRHSRRREFAFARFAAAYLLRKYTDMSSAQIGQVLGGRDHSTVLHAIKRARQLQADSQSFGERLEQADSEVAKVLGPRAHYGVPTFKSVRAK